MDATRLSVFAGAAGHDAELIVHVVRHRAGGWVREIERKDDDAVIEAEFDPETGVVTVFEGRREFRSLEKGARRAGLPRARVREYLPYRMLEVEVASNSVYVWAAERIRGTLNQTEIGDTITVSAGIACYPIHALSARELIDRVGCALAAARSHGRDRLEIATAVD